MPKTTDRFSLADTLNSVLPFADVTLVPEAAQSRLRDLALHLPPIARGLLECRFDGRGPVDLSQGVMDTATERSQLANCFRRIADDTVAWRRAMRFMEAWQNGSDTERYAWFEFDLDGPSCSPAPSVFLSVGALGADHGWPLDSLGASTQAIVDSWFKRLPAEAQVDFIGVMLPRSPMALRLNLSNLGADVAWDWLRENGCHLPDASQAVFADFFDAGTPILAVEIDENGLGPRIGLECRPTNAERAARIISLCIEHDLCAATSADTLRSWRGVGSALNSGSEFPVHLILDSLMRDDQAPAVLLRDINHVKVSFSATGLEQAKVYLLFRHTHDKSAPRQLDG